MRFSIFFRDHFNKLSKIDDYIVDVEDGIFEISNHLHIHSIFQVLSLDNYLLVINNLVSS